jgi:hypothetical protein
MKLEALPGIIPLLALFVVVACGPTPPDFAGLAGHEVEACGEVFGADEIVRRAYDGDATGSLPTDVGLPEGTIAASVLDTDGDAPRRRYPCARDAAHADALLSEMGYRDASRLDTDGKSFVYEAIDTYGLAGTYALFACDFVGDVTSRRDGSLIEQGLFGAFGENGGHGVDDGMIRDLAARTFATGMTQLAWEGRPRYVDGPVLLGSEREISTFQLGADQQAEGIGVCVTWVEPDLWGGCDFVRVGITRTGVLDRDGGDFHQLAIHNLLGHHGFPGWCGRRE